MILDVVIDDLLAATPKTMPMKKIIGNLDSINTADNVKRMRKQATNW